MEIGNSYATVNVEEDANFVLRDNLLINNSSDSARVNNSIIELLEIVSLNIYGNMTLVNNFFKDEHNGIGALIPSTIWINSTTPNRNLLNIGSGIVKVEALKPYDEISKRNTLFGMYLRSQSLVTQLSATSFNENNRIENVAIGNHLRELTTGIVVANNNFVKSTEVAEKSFTASTFSNAIIKHIKEIKTM